MNGSHHIDNWVQENNFQHGFQHNYKQYITIQALVKVHKNRYLYKKINKLLY